ncbi:MAG: glycosyl transferase family protein [Parcubacteria group bacterium Athens1014_10]|nr:MAG: glycosyl transferase family protein [Parcubacteria group bacterium Athens1014_10]TSD05558.1 MAG: glycosyl transferase family protein [Parcubacteria group bacterium Athens0714_12]
MKKVKVAFVLSGLGHIQRGTETFFTEVMKKLSYKEDLEIFAFGGGKDFNLKNVNYSRVPCFKRQLFNHFPKIKRLHLTHGHDYEGLFFAISLIPKLLTKKFDLIFFSSFPYELLTYKIYKLFVNKKVKIVFSSGGGSCWFYSRFFFADCVQSTDPMSQKFFSKRFYSVCIPAGTNSNIFYPQKVSRATLDLPDDKFIIFSSSAFEKVKRIDFLIKAASQIKNAYLLLTSAGPEEKNIKELGYKLMGNNIKFLGMVDQQTLVKCYSLADVFCLPSKTEPFGLVLIESMACGTPVVTNNTEIQKWIVNGGGTCVDVTNMNSLIEALEKYKDKKLISQIGEEARKNVLKRFTWDIAAEKYYQLFKELVNK